MELPPPTIEAPSEPAGKPAMSLPARLLNVFATPGDVFDCVRTTPSCVANWLTPALLCIVISWVGGWLILSQPGIQQQLNEISAKAVEQQIAKTHPPEAQAEQMRNAAEKVGSIGAKVNAVVLPVLATFGTTFWWALLLWLVGVKGFKAGFPFMKAAEVAGVANMLLLLDAIVRTLLILGLENIFATPSLMLLVSNFDPQNHPLHAALNSINILTLWRLALLSIGLSRLSSVSTAKAGAWIYGIWLASTGLLLGFGFGIQALMRQVH